MKRSLTIISLLSALLLIVGPSWSYPLDGGGYTGIARLDHQTRILPEGAKLPMADVDLRLLARQDFELPDGDADLRQKLLPLLGDEADRYALAVLDLSDPDRPRYAEHRGEVNQNPGSVGKLVIALGVFQALADSYPDDIPARERVLRETRVTADDFILSDHHKVPFWTPGSSRLSYRRLAIGDQASLWTYLDWMLSASSNAAASMVLRELLLLKHFGRDFPVSREEEEEFWTRTPKSELSDLLETAL